MQNFATCSLSLSFLCLADGVSEIDEMGAFKGESLRAIGDIFGE